VMTYYYSRSNIIMDIHTYIEDITFILYNTILYYTVRQDVYTPIQKRYQIDVCTSFLLLVRAYDFGIHSPYLLESHPLHHQERNSMPTHKGYTASIYDVETGLPFHEYSTSLNIQTDISICYIETKPDQPFTIVLRDNQGQFSQGTAVYVDGSYVDNGLTGPGVATERRWFGKRVDHMHVKPFVFRRCETGKFKCEGSVQMRC
jgi:hypothetical protein